MSLKKLGVLLLAAVFAAAMPLQGKVRYDRSGKKQVSELNGSNVTIVLQSSSPVTRYAAEELQQHLSQILGKKIPLAAVPGKDVNIYVGFGAFAKSKKVVSC